LYRLGDYFYQLKVVVNGNSVVVKDTPIAMGVLLATTKLVAKGKIVVVVVLQLATTLCVVVKKITTKQILWLLNF
jgi:membrane-associated PAP2 superfamily phosphatase